MNVSIKQLSAFVAVAQSQSFAEACERIHLSQPALSISIKNLEDALGGALFTRSTRAVSLTPEGERLLPMAKRLLADWDQTLGDISDLFTLARGRLSIAAMPSFAEARLPEALADFRSKFPNIKISLHDVLNESVLEMTRAGRVELGICFKPAVTDDLEFTELFSDEMVALLPVGHALCEQTEITWQALQNYPMVALAPPSNVRAYIDDMLAEHDLSLGVEVEVNQLATIKRLVALGVGVSAVPRMCVDTRLDVDVVYRPLSAPVLSRSIGLVVRKRYTLSSAAKAMREHILQRCKGEKGGALC
ncbi:LysR family transcriptional regulator [Halioxenophilus sp. WMMB6]|uniref:LysR family transcriptional regulator n=1 Tax=Halioxenophilus sp. WMMB6 TaxID=3073815 RepID=UPI00295E9457|nr:LysR substrate-binding domain-containing protein [Halioxenophilus sp. WMMB6]